MAPLNDPSTDLQAWDRAYRKVASLLRAYEVENSFVRHELAHEIVHEAMPLLAPGQEPEAVAVDNLRCRLSAWLRRLNNATDEKGRNGYSEARMLTIVQASRIIQRWPQCFLSGQEFDPAMLQAVREARIIGVPNMHRASIGVPQIQFETVSDMAEGTRRIFSNSILRICVFSACLVGRNCHHHHPGPMSTDETPPSTTPATPWARVLFFGLHTLLTIMGGAIYWDLLNRAGFTATGFLLLVLFVILFAHITFGFLQPLFGLFISLRKQDPHAISRTIDLDKDPATIELSTRTALIFPIYNEDPDRFFAGVETVYHRLQQLGQIEHYDVFVLSDSTDADHWIAEEIAWNETALRLGAHGKLFYRRRRNNINQKSGNVADFCRRWAGSYDTMLCFDADSLMSGECIVRMTEMMERNPQVGIIQTMPGLLNGRTLLARLQQFTNRVHGHLSGAGLNAWQQNYGNYWGHNAIIRLKPFLKYCTLPELPGVEPLGGRVLSHDFVEAVLMHKAGFEVWLAYDMAGSYEEMPPTLIDLAKRDRRWCQGNLQHIWLVLFGKIPNQSRIHMINGIMGYLASPLWLLFLGLTTLATYQWVGSDLTLVVRDSSLPLMPESLADQGLILLGLTAVMIFGPKLMTLVWLAFRSREAKGSGGWFKAAASILVEVLFFTVIAPSMMLFHSGFVITILLGQKVKWSTQVRDSGDGTTFREAFAAHRGHFAVGLLWGILAWMVSPMLFWWMSPVLLGWLLAIPLSIYTSRESTGQWFRQRGLLLTPEETEPPQEVRDLRERTREGAPLPASVERFEDIGLLGVVLDPYINALHGLLMRERSQPDPHVRQTLQKLEDKLLHEGAEALSNAEKMRLLLDYESTVRLHKQVWSQPDHQLSPWWQEASRSFNYRSLFNQRSE